MSKEETITDEASLDTEADNAPALQRARERIAWRRSAERKAALIQTSTAFAIVLALNTISIYLYQSSKGHNFTFSDWWSISPTPENVGWTSLAIMFFGSIAATQPYRLQLTHFRDKRLLADAHAELEQAEQDLRTSDSSQDGPSDFLQLWHVNQKRLDYYHEIATAQARQSFRNAQLAMGVGFIVLVAAAAATIRASSATSAAITGVLGAIGAGLAAYVGRTFVKTQEEAANHLRSYFAQPLEMSRYLLTERMLERSAETSWGVAAKDVALAILTQGRASTTNDGSPTDDLPK